MSVLKKTEDAKLSSLRLPLMTELIFLFLFIIFTSYNLIMWMILNLLKLEFNTETNQDMLVVGISPAKLSKMIFNVVKTAFDAVTSNHIQSCQVLCK